MRLLLFFLAAQHLTYFISASNSFPLLLDFISIQLLRITTFAHFIKNFTHQNSKYLRILSHSVRSNLIRLETFLDFKKSDVTGYVQYENQK